MDIDSFIKDRFCGESDSWEDAKKFFLDSVEGYNGGRNSPRTDDPMTLYDAYHVNLLIIDELTKKNPDMENVLTHVLDVQDRILEILDLFYMASFHGWECEKGDVESFEANDLESFAYGFFDKAFKVLDEEE